MEEKMRSIADRMAEIVVKINRLEDEKKAKVKEYTEQIRSEEQILFLLASQYQRLENGEEELPFPDTGLPTPEFAEAMIEVNNEFVANLNKSKKEPVPVTPLTIEGLFPDGAEGFDSMTITVGEAKDGE